MDNKRVLQLKMTVLVVLFLGAILLLYLLWMPENAELNFSRIFDFGRAPVQTMDHRGLLVPDSVNISRGDGSFTLQVRECEKSMELALSILKEYYSYGFLQLEEISREQYLQALDGFKSAELDFGFSLPFGFIAELGGFEESGAAAELLISRICFSSAARDSVILVDGQSPGFWRLVFSGPIDCMARFSALELEDEPALAWRADSMLGLGNDELLPLAMSSNAIGFEIRPEAYGDEYLAQDMAEDIFGDTFDFVRRISDSFGNVTYMYGYGEKSFYAGIDGYFEYTSSAAGSEATGFSEDLQRALAFIEACGGLKKTGESTGLRLCGYSENGGRVKDRTFLFTQSFGGRPVAVTEGAGLKVSLSGGSITGFTRRLYRWMTGLYGDVLPCAEASNVIASNSNHIYNILNNNTLAAASSEAFEFAAGETVSMLPGYFADSMDQLNPCWILRTKDGTAFYFDLYNGRPLGFCRSQL